MTEERRKDKRTQMRSQIVIKQLDGSGSKEAEINIEDVSKSGIGFMCPEMLQIGEVYEAYLTIWTQEIIHAFLQIVRIELRPDGYSYGGVFIGMPEMDSARIETYQTVSDMCR